LQASKKPASAQEREIFRNPTERRAWVIFQLKIRGRTLPSLAREQGVSQQALGAALSSPSQALEAAIADAVERHVTDLFPERFASDGRRLHLTRGPNRNSATSAHNVQFAEAR
jgi:Ner family transcriptional regulator